MPRKDIDKGCEFSMLLPLPLAAAALAFCNFGLPDEGEEDD